MVGAMAGSASALFLWLLEGATRQQWEHPWLLWCLPVAGLVIAWGYGRWGRAAGMDALLEELQRPQQGLSMLMAPLVLAGTVLTHLCGGSAGREGTAVQMGGSLAATLARLFRQPPERHGVWLLAGMAGGFGSVFGTPIAGAVFAMEVVVAGRWNFAATVPTLVASVVGHLTCLAWGIEHTNYRLLVPHLDASWALLGKVIVAGGLFGWLAWAYCGFAHGLQRRLSLWMPSPLLRVMVGGVVIIAMTYALGTRDYLGLGVRSATPNGVSLLACFQEHGATPWSWWWKFLFTAVTLASGFKGGEVTPLFFIGAAAGHTLGVLGNESVALFAALGVMTVFSSAAKVPLTGAILGVELFGAPVASLGALACAVAYLASGRRGLYAAQGRRDDTHGQKPPDPL